MFMVDIAVPRDIEPQVAELADVFLYTVDDLEIVEENRRTRLAAAAEAETLIEQAEELAQGRARGLEPADALPGAGRSRQRPGTRATPWGGSMMEGVDDREHVARLSRLTNKLIHTLTRELQRRRGRPSRSVPPRPATARHPRRRARSTCSTPIRRTTMTQRDLGIRLDPAAPSRRT